MIKALAHHILLLLVMRHDGRGLPVKRTLVFWLLITVSTLVASIRLGLYGGGAHGATLALIASFIVPPVVAGWALISVGVETVRMATNTIQGTVGGSNIIWGILELVLLFVFVSKFKRSAKAKAALDDSAGPK